MYDYAGFYSAQPANNPKQSLSITRSLSRVETTHLHTTEAAGHSPVWRINIVLAVIDIDEGHLGIGADEGLLIDSAH